MSIRNELLEKILTATEAGPQSDLDLYLKYNPETDQLETTKAIQSGLNSFKLGESVTVSASGSGLATKNEITQRVSYAASSSLEAHSNPLNRGVDGVIRVSVPDFGEAIEFEPRGEPAPSGAVNFTLETTLAQSLSIFEIDVILEESIEEGDVLLYAIRDRNAPSVEGGFISIYEQKLRPAPPLNPGDTLKWAFTENSNILAGTDLLVEMHIDKGGLGVDVSPLRVRPSTDDTNNIYAKLYAREYSIKTLAYESELDTEQDKLRAGIAAGSMYVKLCKAG